MVVLLSSALLLWLYCYPGKKFSCTSSEGGCIVIRRIIVMFVLLSRKKVVMHFIGRWLYCYPVHYCYDCIVIQEKSCCVLHQTMVVLLSSALLLWLYCYPGKKFLCTSSDDGCIVIQRVIVMVVLLSRKKVFVYFIGRWLYCYPARSQMGVDPEDHPSALQNTNHHFQQTTKLIFSSLLTKRDLMNVMKYQLFQNSGRTYVHMNH